MAKQSGIGDNLWVDGYDLSGDIGSLSRIAGGFTPLELTAINQEAPDRTGGKRDGGIDFSSWFNDAASAAHPVLRALPYGSRIVTYLRGTALGAAGCSLMGKQLNYDPTEGQDGSLAIATSTQASDGYGVEWGNLYTSGKRTDTGATAGTAVDFGAASNFGLQAWLHVFAFTGTDVTIKLQESSDNSGDPYADVTGGAFTAVTSAPQAQRIQTARTLAVERYLKVVTTTSGGFTSVQFGVIVCRNESLVTF